MFVRALRLIVPLHPRSRRNMSTTSASSVLELPSKGVTRSVLIFSHGLGDVGESWSDEMEVLQDQFPNLKVILPTAPIRPVTLNGGMRMTAWYDLKDLSARSSEDMEGLTQSRDIIWKMVDKEIASGVASKQIFLGGFSQGAALSIFAGYAHSAPLGGVIALSGYLPLASGFASRLSAANRTLPLFMGHGTADPVVALAWARLSVDALRQSNIALTFTEYPRLPHSISRQEMADLAAWLKPLLAPPQAQM